MNLPSLGRARATAARATATGEWCSASIPTRPSTSSHVESRAADARDAALELQVRRRRTRRRSSARRPHAQVERLDRGPRGRAQRARPRTRPTRAPAISSRRCAATSPRATAGHRRRTRTQSPPGSGGSPMAADAAGRPRRDCRRDGSVASSPSSWTIRDHLLPHVGFDEAVAAWKGPDGAPRTSSSRDRARGQVERRKRATGRSGPRRAAARRARAGRALPRPPVARGPAGRRRDAADDRCRPARSSGSGCPRPARSRTAAAVRLPGHARAALPPDRVRDAAH